MCIMCIFKCLSVHKYIRLLFNIQKLSELIFEVVLKLKKIKIIDKDREGTPLYGE